MKLINNLTDNPRQSFQVPIEGGEYIQFNLYYYVTQKSWFFDFTYNNYTANGNRIVLSPNTLRHLKNIIPFGLAFMAEGNVEPFDLTDFSSGRVKMYILNAGEVEEIESTIYNA